MKKISILALCCLLSLNFLKATEADAFYYTPQGGFCGDPMPFYDEVEDVFRVYYLYERRPNSSTYHPVYAISTTNFYQYDELGMVLPTGSVSSQDAAIGTGSVYYMADEQTYFFYYTGNRNDATQGDVQVVMRATSADGIQWEKDADFALAPTPLGYHTWDFRDPEIFVDDAGLYHMLVSTKKNGKNCLAEFTSTDLRDWTHQGIFMDMQRDRFYECPNVFKMGDWWYMTYSELNKNIRSVQYFKAPTLDSLKHCATENEVVWPDDSEGYLNSRGYYAGKTASDGTNRYMWGWCPTRPNSDNTRTNNASGEPDWAGTLVAHKLLQHADGTLALVPIDSIASSLGAQVQLPGSSVSLAAGDPAMQMAKMESKNHLNMSVTVADPSNFSFGISLCHNPRKYNYYALQVQPDETGCIVHFLQRGEGGIGVVPFIDSYRFHRAEDGVYDINVYTDESVLTLYINDDLCYTNRIYSMVGYNWGLECYQGSISVTDIEHHVVAAPTAIEAINQDNQPTKVFMDGVILIRRNGQTYTLTGEILK